MKLTSGHDEIIKIFRRCGLVEKETHVYELKAPRVFEKIERLQVELGNIGYAYLNFEFKHSKFPKITMVPEPEILFRMSA